MAKIFGGSASRAEVYGLFIAAVILVGGGVSGAIVLTSGSDTPREATTAVVAGDSPDSTTTVVGGSGGTGTVETVPPSGSGGSTAVEPRTTVSIAGMTEEQAQIVREYVTRQTEAQRQAQVWAEEEAFRVANPAGRLVSVEFLSCPSFRVDRAGNPGMLMEIDKLVTYRVTYEVFHTLHEQSEINPGSLGWPQSGTSQELLDFAEDTFAQNLGREPLQVDLELDVGVHSGIFYGVALQSVFGPTVDVRLRPVDSTYGWVQIEVPMDAPNCS